MSALAQIGEQSLAVTSAAAAAPLSGGIAAVEPIVCVADPVEPYKVVVLATSSGAEGQTRAHAAARTVEEYLESHCSDVAAEALQQAFREANAVVGGHLDDETADDRGVSMLVAVLRGKYLSIALLGDHRGYLLRSGRVTPLTRDMRVDKVKGQRNLAASGQSADKASSQPVALLGERDRLDSRFPAIFELTVLPDDELAFISRGLADLLADVDMTGALVPNAEQAAANLVQLARADSDAPVMAAVLAAGPAREMKAADYQRPASGPNRTIVVVLILLLTMLVIAGLLLLV